MSFIITPRRGAKNFQESLSPDMAELAAREAEIAQRVKREVLKSRAQAEAEGREAGYAEGFATGKTEAEAAMQSAAAALAAATAQVAAPLALKQADLAGLITKFSLALAAHITGCEISTSTASITALAEKLLAQAACERQPASHILLRLNPADHAALTSLALPPETTLMADTAIAQGGVLLEISHPATTHPAAIWDATIQSRLAALL